MSRRNREKRTAVRGNMATYTAEKPLFGKYVGSVYRPDHERGIAESAQEGGEVIVIGKDEERKQQQTQSIEEKISLVEEMQLTREMIGKQKGLITLELWAYEADILINAILGRQIELACRNPHSLDYDREELTLEAIESELRGQLRMLALIRRARQEA